MNLIVKDDDTRRAVVALQRGLQAAVHGPWCSLCKQNFYGKEPRQIHDHVWHVHMTLAARTLCRMFGWAWIIRGPYWRELLHRSEQFDILVAKNKRLKAEIAELKRGSELA